MIEVLAIIVVLGLVLTIGGYSVVGVIKTSREEPLEIFKGNVKSGLINYYNECKYTTSSVCYEGLITEKTIKTTIGDLVSNGFLDNQGSEDNKLIIENPVTNEDLFDFEVSTEYDSDDQKFSEVFYGNNCGSLKNSD